MTVSNTTSRNQYTATSGQTVFPYTFEIFDKNDIAVLKNGTLLSEGTNYTVSGVGNDSGGNITLTVGATAGDILTFYRDMAYQRLTDYQNSGDFLAQEVNDDFDRLWLAVQQNSEGNDRAIVKPITDSASIDMTLPSAVDRANSYLTFDATGAPSVVAAGDPSAPDAITRQDFTGDGSTVVYTLASAPGAAGAGVMIFIDGIQQDKDSYTITGTTLTFSEAPPLNSNINLVQLKATDIGEADSASVTYIPAGTGAVQTSVQSKLRETVSVKDFGAVGDGVTDDTAAIQAAIDYAGDTYALHIPVGQYFCASTLYPTSGLRMLGENNITTVISEIYTTASSLFTIDDTNVNANNSINGLILRGISFKGDGTNKFVDVNVSAGFGDIAFGEISSCYVRNFLTVELIITGTYINHNNFYNCRKFVFSGGDANIRNNFFNTVVSAISADDGCVYLSSLSNTLFDGNYITSAEPSGIVNPRALYIDQGEHLRITNNWFDRSDKQLIYVNAVDNLSIMFNKLNATGGTTEPVYIVNSNNVTFALNTTYNIAAGVYGANVLGTSDRVKFYDNTWEGVDAYYTAIGGLATITNMDVKQRDGNIFDVTSNTTIYSMHTGRTVTNRGATGQIYVYLNNSPKRGDVIYIRRVAPYNMVVYDNALATSKLIMNDRTSQYIRVICYDDGSWTLEQLDGVYMSEVASAFNGAGYNINLKDKYVGKMVYSITAGKPVWATGSGATDTWIYADGTTAYTPS